MREILFRGKSNWTEGKVKKGDWLYSMTISKHCYNDEEITSYYIGGGNKTIDGKTLGQYTGLADKNGTKIFEGDIVKVFLKDGVEIGYIRYRDAGCRFQFMGEYSIGYNIDNTTEFEVIGNIHDNPELLGGDEE